MASVRKRSTSWSAFDRAIYAGTVSSTNNVRMLGRRRKFFTRLSFMRRLLRKDIQYR